MSKTYQKNVNLLFLQHENVFYGAIKNLEKGNMLVYYFFNIKDIINHDYMSSEWCMGIKNHVLNHCFLRFRLSSYEDNEFPIYVNLTYI